LHACPADGDFVTVVAAVAISDDGVELAGAVEDAFVVGWGVVLPEAQLAGLAVIGVDEVPRESEVNVCQGGFSF
jgi:hypothetical protein